MEEGDEGQERMTKKIKGGKKKGKDIRSRRRRKREEGKGRKEKGRGSRGGKRPGMTSRREGGVLL